MKKNVMAILMTAVLAVSAAACGSQEKKTAETKGQMETSGADEQAGAEEEPSGNSEVSSNEAAGDLTFEIVSKGFQHEYWQSVLKGAQNKAAELGVTVNFVGPNSESDIADQVQMLNNAVNAKPDAIGLAALDTSACLDAIQAGMDAEIPVIGFDSGVPDAPEGAVWANCATDNYTAGELAGEELYKAAADRISSADGTVRIGVISQDATSESITQRGLGFIDKVYEHITSEGKTVSVEGNDKYVSDSIGATVSDADVIIEVLVPAQVTSELSAIDCQTLMNKEDTIAIYGTNQHSGQAMVTANENIGKFGSGEDDIIGVAFDSGQVIKGAVADGTFIGAVTQAPVAMGEELVQQLYYAATGAEVVDVDTGCQWYHADNMNDEEIAQNLYD